MSSRPWVQVPHGTLGRKSISFIARLAQSVERKTFNLVVVGSSPTAGTRVVTLSNSGEKVSLVSPQWRNWIAHQTSNLGVVGSSPTWGILQGGRKW